MVVTAASVLAGCAAEDLDTRTDAMARGTVASAQSYLNDAASLAAEIRAFSATLAEAGDTITPAEARGMAPALTQRAERARSLCIRMGAQRLDDSRLERQRTAVVAPLNRVCTSMETIARLATQGNVRVMAQRIQDLPAQIDEVRSQGAS